MLLTLNACSGGDLNSQLEGVKFRRQQPIERYIADFISFEKKIAIELDGGQQSENTCYDTQRNACLKANGFTVLRFWNNEVIKNASSGEFGLVVD